MKMKQFSRIAAVFMLGICTAGCVSEQEAAPVSDSIPPETAAAETAAAQQELSEEEIIASVIDSGKEQTVCIFTPNGNNGTGFIHNRQYVITNEHVLYDTDDFTMQDVNGREYTGTVIYRDPADDIAVIRAEDMNGSSVIFGDSDALSVGDTLICIGNPAEGEPFSSCTGRCLELDEALEQKIDRNRRFIHADADIVSGYSGGPVFNMNGELIGSSTAAYILDLSAYEFDHLSLIIPISRVREQIETACTQQK